MSKPVKFPSTSMPSTIVKKHVIDEESVFAYDEIETADIDSHMHYVIIGFQWLDPDTGDLYDSVTFEVEAKSWQEALIKAKAMYDRKGYKITRIYEVCKEAMK